MEKFEKAELEVIELDAKDVIATSGCPTDNPCPVDNDDCPIEGEFIPF